MLIIAEIFNEITNKLTIYGILCRNVTIFYRQEHTDRQTYAYPNSGNRLYSKAVNITAQMEKKKLPK